MLKNLVLAEGSRLKSRGENGFTVECCAVASSLEPRASSVFPFSFEPRASSRVPKERPGHATDGLRDTSGLFLTPLDPIRTQLTQPPPSFGRFAEPFDQMGQLRRALEELQRAFEFLGGRRAAVEIVVDGEDLGALRQLQLALLLAGELQGVEGARVSAPNDLLGGKEHRQGHAADFGPFEL